MKFGTIEKDGGECLIAKTSETEAVAVGELCRAAGIADPPLSMIELIEGGPVALSKVREAISKAPPGVGRIKTSDASWLPPLRKPGKVLCTVHNSKRLRATLHVDPGHPNYASKPRTALVGHNRDIVINRNYGETFGEPEMAAIVSKGGKNIPVEQALDHVFGYSIVNDVTSHGLKYGIDSVAASGRGKVLPVQIAWRRSRGPEHEGDVYYTYHTRSKGCDTFGPMGPWITTSDEVADPNNLEMRGYFDGVLIVKDPTSVYSFSVQQIVADASKYFTLEAGDILVCGTASTIVPNERFPLGLRSVDMHKLKGKFTVEIEGLGRLENNVAHSWE